MANPVKYAHARIIPLVSSASVTALVKNWLPPLFYSALLLSPISIDLFNIDNHYIFEIPLIISVLVGLFLNDHIFALFRKALHLRTPTLIAVYYITLMFVIGSLAGNGVGAAYSDYRANLVVVFGFLFGREAIRSNPLILVRLGLSAGFLSATYFIIKYGLTGELYRKYITSYLALTVAAIVGSWLGRRYLSLTALPIIIFLSVVSFYRQYWIAAFITVALATISWTGSSSALKRALYSLALFGAVVGAILTLLQQPAVINFFNTNEQFQGQIISKTQTLLNGLSSGGINEIASSASTDSSDATRLNYFSIMINHPLDLLIPHGLGHASFGATGKLFPRYFQNYSQQGGTLDSLIFYIAFHYGLLVSIALMSWMLFRLKICIRRCGIVFSLLAYFLLWLILLFDGTQAAVILEAFWFGVFVSVLFYPLQMRGNLQMKLSQSKGYLSRGGLNDLHKRMAQNQASYIDNVL